MANNDLLVMIIKQWRGRMERGNQSHGESETSQFLDMDTIGWMDRWIHGLASKLELSFDAFAAMTPSAPWVQELGCAGRLFNGRHGSRPERASQKPGLSLKFKVMISIDRRPKSHSTFSFIL
jgi:hypothetical protein